MRTQIGWTVVWAVVLGSLLFVPAAMAMGDGDPVVDEEEVVFFTDATGPDEDGDGTIDPPAAGQLYCVYTVGPMTLEGDCGFKTGDRVCVDCPASGTCPTPANQLKNFVYKDASGKIICRGEWSRSFDVTKPDACLVCNGGKTGYWFL